MSGLAKAEITEAAMDKERLVQNVEALRKIVSDKSTGSVLSKLYAYNFSRNNYDKPSELTSPAVQTAFLRGLLLATPEPSEPREFNDKDWKKVKELLEAVFMSYLELFMPLVEGLESERKTDKEIKWVASRVFFHYFNTSYIATTEQMRSRIRNRFVPFDAQIKAELGITASEIQEIVEWIFGSAHKNLDELYDLTEAASRKGKELKLRSKDPTFSMEEQFRRPDYRNVGDRLYEATADIGMLHPEKLTQRFPQTGADYLRNFAISRGKVTGPTYPTDKVGCDLKPLVNLEDGRLAISDNVLLLTSVIEQCEVILLKGENKNKYLKRRDDTLEEECEAAFIKLLAGKGSVFSSVCETSNGQFEHDVVVVHENILIVAEAKASPLDEPFRDPKKAFIRIKGAFNADSGIQHGFVQASRLLRRMDAGEDIPLYDKKGNLLITLKPSLLTNRFAMVITGEDFGPLATDLSLLLKREPTDPYPWVTNIFDLQAIVEAWQFLGKSIENLTEYITERKELHGKVYSSDELEILGCYLSHGSITKTLKPDAQYFLAPSYSNFFDQLFFHLHAGGPKPTLSESKIFMLSQEDFLSTKKSYSPEKIEEARAKLKEQRKLRRSLKKKNIE